MKSYFYITLIVFIILVCLLSIVPYPLQKERFQIDITVDKLSCYDYLADNKPEILGNIVGNTELHHSLQDLSRVVVPVESTYDSLYSDLHMCVIDADKKSSYGLARDSCAFSNYNLNMFSSNNELYPNGCYIDPTDPNFYNVLNTMYKIKNTELLNSSQNLQTSMSPIVDENMRLWESWSNLNRMITSNNTIIASKSNDIMTYDSQITTLNTNYTNILSEVNKIGKTVASPALSAMHIKNITGTVANGIYYIKCDDLAKQTYCLMDPLYDGGGWMLLMKTGFSSTFNFSSDYWTNPSSLLRETSLNVTNFEDAKFHAFNSVPIKDVMLIFVKEDIDGMRGGSVPGNPLGWSWILNNWYDNGKRIRAIDGFNQSRVVTPSDPTMFSGWNNRIFSSKQSNGVHRHIIGGHSDISERSGRPGGIFTARWGFVANNENDFMTVDVCSGIGIGKYESNIIFNPSINYQIPEYSSGDFHRYGTGTVGMNRPIRCLLFGR